jgi:hypothetical protein
VRISNATFRFKSAAWYKKHYTAQEWLQLPTLLAYFPGEPGSSSLTCHARVLEGVSPSVTVGNTVGTYSVGRKRATDGDGQGCGSHEPSEVKYHASALEGVSPSKGTWYRYQLLRISPPTGNTPKVHHRSGERSRVIGRERYLI